MCFFSTPPLGGYSHDWLAALLLVNILAPVGIQTGSSMYTWAILKPGENPGHKFPFSVHLDNVIFCQCRDMVMEWCCFVLIQRSHGVALSDVNILWNRSCWIRERHGVLAVSVRPGPRNIKTWLITPGQLLGVRGFLSLAQGFFSWYPMWILLHGVGTRGLYV